MAVTAGLMFRQIFVPLLLCSIVGCKPPPTLQDGIAAYEASDYVKAMKIFQNSTLKNSAEAQKRMAGLYDMGLGVEKDSKKATEHYQFAAENGDTESQWYIGTIDFRSADRAVKENGIRWLEKVAAQGNLDYQLDLGKMYLKDGNAVKAAKWIQESAKQGEAEAQYELAKLFSEGKGVIKDYQQALFWAQKSANQKFEYAHSLLSYWYSEGDVVAKDLTKAHMHFNIANSMSKSSGSAINVALSKDLERDMASDQILKSQALAREWVATHK